MDISVKPYRISGTVNAVSSKSEAHRVFLCAALSEDSSDIMLNDTSLDIDATLECIKALGADVTRRDNIHTVNPFSSTSSVPVFDCKTSGSTLRFFLPPAAALLDRSEFVCGEQLGLRPIKPLLDALRANGALISSDRPPLKIEGRLRPGDYHISGNISSQFVSGLMFALPLLDGNSRIIIDSPLKSKSYAEMTVRIIKRYGIKLHWDEREIEISGNQKYRAPEISKIGGDYSNSAVILGAAALGGKCSVCGLDKNSVQGDRAIIDCLKRFGASVSVSNDICTVEANKKKPIDVDISDIPDLFPTLAVLACGACGNSYFYGTDRLKYKESDRCASVLAMLEALGVHAVALSDRFVVCGTGSVNGGRVNSMNDHRIVMAAAMAASIANDTVTIGGSESVRKSYPEFFKDLSSLGADISVEALR